MDEGKLLKKVVLRADGNHIIGLGHVYRMLALAEILKTNTTLKIVFVSSASEPFLKEKISAVCDELLEVKPFKYILPDQREDGEEIPFDMEEILSGEEIVITDGYWFGTQYQRRVKARGCRLICVDDLVQWHYVSDVIINHAPGLNPSSYSCESYTKVCTGLDYLILRPQFFEKTSVTPRRESVYVSLGGIDHYGYAYHVCKLILRKGKKVELLISGDAGSESNLKLDQLAQENTSLNIHRNADASQIVKILNGCSHAVVSASTVALEAVARGIKPLAGYYIDNQKNIYEGLVNTGLAVGLGSFHELENAVILEYLNTEQRLPDFSLNSQVNLLKVILG